MLAVTQASTGTYVLFQKLTDSRTVLVGKRTAAGRFAAAQTIGTGERVDSGDIIASGGKWWAVWAEDAGAGLKLYQAKTIGTRMGRRALTGFNVASNNHVGLAFAPGGGALMVWARQRLNTGVSASMVVLSTSRDGNWRSRDLQGGYDPQVARAGADTWVAWAADRFVRPGVFVAERSVRGSWTGAYVTSVDPPSNGIDVVAARGRAAVLYSSSWRLLGRIQR